MLARLFRLTVGYFSPTALAILLLELFETNRDGWGQPQTFLSAYIRLLGDVYPHVMFQAGVYAILMEFVINPLSPNRWVIASISAFLCAVAAAAYTTTLLLYGIASGFCVGLILAILYRFGDISVISK
jgi:hypothetical protein